MYFGHKEQERCCSSHRVTCVDLSSVCFSVTSHKINNYQSFVSCLRVDFENLNALVSSQTLSGGWM